MSPEKTTTTTTTLTSAFLTGIVTTNNNNDSAWALGRRGLQFIDVLCSQGGGREKRTNYNGSSAWLPLHQSHHAHITGS